MSAWEAGAVQPLSLTALGERYHRYRLTNVNAEADMARSLQRYGQQSPIVVCLRDEMPEVVDGFKRLAAARVLGWTSLSTRLLTAEERIIKAAIYGLNSTGRRTQEWEEAWIVYALVRDDGLPQVEVAELLGRHKSWVCRRLALLEKLAEDVQAELRLGLVAPTAARALVRLPAGNQAEVLASGRRAELTAAELDGVVDLFAATTGRLQQECLLANPRQALAQAKQEGGWAHDPRLSVAGNRIARRLHLLLEGLARMEAWLVNRGRADLSPVDRQVLLPAWRRLAHDSDSVAGLTHDLLGEEPAHDRATA
jgi:ParB-like chromosome segregation protein Spo0J